MTLRHDAKAAHEPVVRPKGLHAGALGLTSSVVIGLSSTAPAYSLAASLGLVVVIVGEKTPAVMLLAFVPMYFIAVAFRELNKVDPDCGTTFTWAGRAFGPSLGWLGGWCIIAADVIVMANLAAVAGQYSFLVFGLDDLAGSTLWTTVVGIAWIAIMTWVCQRGIEISARVQTALLSVEVLLLAILVLLALVKVLAGDAIGRAAAPTLDWLWPSGISLSDLVDAVLIAVFLYWGWDTAVSVNEEADEPRRTPGRAAVMSTVLLMVTYVLVAFAAVAFAGTGSSGIGLANPDNAADVFASLGPAIFGDNALGHVLQVLLLVSVLTSSAASTQTTILPTARGALAMASYRAIPTRFARVHPEHRTPTTATWAMGGVSILFFAGLTFVSENVLTDSIAAIGLLIAFYYGLTGFACVWQFRRELHGRGLWTKGIMPGLGGLMLLGAFVLSAISYLPSDSGETSVFGVGGIFVIGVGSLLLGAVLMLGYRYAAPAYFHDDTLGRTAHDQVMRDRAAAGRAPGDPASRDRATQHQAPPEDRTTRGGAPGSPVASDQVGRGTVLDPRLSLTSPLNRVRRPGSIVPAPREAADEEAGHALFDPRS